MKLVLPLAFRNLFRTPRRSLLTAVPIVVGVAFVIIGWGLVGGLEENILRAEEDVLSGHVVLLPADHLDPDLGWAAEDARPIPEQLEAELDRVASVWTTRTLFDGSLVKGPDRLAARGVSYDPERDPEVFPRDNWQVEGTWPTGDEIAMGSGLAEVLDIQIGDAVFIESRTFEGAQNAVMVKVTGLVTTSNATMDDQSYWIPHQAAEALVAVGDRRTHVGVRLSSRRGAETVAKTLTRDDWVGLGARERAADKLALNAFRKRAVSMVVLILMAIAATGIANTATMAAYERIKEIGTLRAIGFSKMRIQMLFLFEGALLGLAAAALGATVGSSVVSVLSVKGLDFGDVGAAGAAAGTTILYLQLSGPAVVGALGFGILTSLLASLVPARFAASLNPADAVRAN